MGAIAKLVQMLLGIAFLAAGGQKLAGSDQAVDLFARFRYPQWLRGVTGAIEVAGAAGMLLGLRRPAFVPAAGLALGGVLIGAVASHIRQGDARPTLMRPLVLLVMTTVVSLARLQPSRGTRQRRNGT